jgi:hypothetical protein
MKQETLNKLLKLNEEITSIDRELQSIGLSQGELRQIIYAHIQIEHLGIQMLKFEDKLNVFSIGKKGEKGVVVHSYFTNELKKTAIHMCEKNIQFYRKVIDRLLPENLKEDMPLGDGAEEYKTNSGDLHKDVDSGREKDSTASDFYAEKIVRANRQGLTMLREEIEGE